MSFSFQIKAATKAEALDKIVAEMARVVEREPLHAKDQPAVNSIAAAYIELIPDERAESDIYANVNGSLGWTGALGTSECVVVSAGVGVSVGWIQRPKS